MNRISEKFLSLLGLCQKAGRLVSGSMICEKTVRSGKAQLIIISQEASEATMERFLGLSRRYKVDLLVAGTQEQLGSSIGKYNRTVLVILDSGFKDMLLKVKNEIQHGGDR